MSSLRCGAAVFCGMCIVEPVDIYIDDRAHSADEAVWISGLYHGHVCALQCVSRRHAISLGVLQRLRGSCFWVCGLSALIMGTVGKGC